MKLTTTKNLILATAAFTTLANANEFENNTAKSFELSLGGFHYDQTVANGLTTVLNEVDFLFIEQSDQAVEADGWGENIELSYKMPSTLGSNLSTDFITFGLDSFSASQNKTVISSAGFVDILPVDGTPSPGEFFNPTDGDTYAQEYDYDYYRFYTSIGQQKNISDSLKVGYSIYLSGGEAELSAAINTPESNLTLSEDIGFISVGPQISLSKLVTITNKLSVNFDASLAALFSRAEFKAQQEFDGFDVYRTSDKSTDFAILADTSLTGSFLFNNNSSLALQAGIKYRNDVYEIRNPRSRPGVDADDASTYNLGASEISQAELFTPYVNLVYTLHF